MTITKRGYTIMSMISQVAKAMVIYNGQSVSLTQHFMKVYGFAKSIGAAEGLSVADLEILEIAALTHDIAIKTCMEKYGRAEGKLQEQEGPAIAKDMLLSLGCEENIIAQVCWLIGHHHTTEGVTTITHRILLEADFLVNAFDGKADKERIIKARENFFATPTGIAFVDSMFV